MRLESFQKASDVANDLQLSSEGRSNEAILPSTLFVF